MRTQTITNRLRFTYQPQQGEFKRYDQIHMLIETWGQLTILDHHAQISSEPGCVDMVIKVAGRVADVQDAAVLVMDTFDWVVAWEITTQGSQS